MAELLSPQCWSTAAIIVFTIWGNVATATPTAQNEQFYQHVYRLIKEEMDLPPPHFSQPLLTQIISGSGFEEPRIRRLLLAGLDSLEEHDKRQTNLWKHLMSVGGTEAPPKQMGKFVNTLVRELRKPLENNGNFLLDHTVKKASGRTKLFAEQGYALIDRLLNFGLKDSEVDTTQYGIEVQGRTNAFELNLDPLYLFFDSRDENYVREKVREIHRFILPRLTARISQLPIVRWALRKRATNALVAPDFHLGFEVDGLRCIGSNTNLQLCMDIELWIEEADGRRVAWRHSVGHCSDSRGIGPSKTLDVLYDEITEVAVESVQGYLTSRR